MCVALGVCYGVPFAYCVVACDDDGVKFLRVELLPGRSKYLNFFPTFSGIIAGISFWPCASPPFYLRETHILMFNCVQFSMWYGIPKSITVLVCTTLGLKLLPSL